MAYGVTQWPKEPDPREPDFGIDGYSPGQLPPYQWWLETTGATGQYAWLNDGIKCTNHSWSANFLSYRPLPGQPFAVQVFVRISGWQVSQIGPPPYSIEYEILISRPPLLRFRGILRLDFPDAIEQRTGIVMVVVNPDTGTIPNPMTITPMKWNE